MCNVGLSMRVCPFLLNACLAKLHWLHTYNIICKSGPWHIISSFPEKAQSVWSNCSIKQYLEGTTVMLLMSECWIILRWISQATSLWYKDEKSGLILREDRCVFVRQSVGCDMWKCHFISSFIFKSSDLIFMSSGLYRQTIEFGSP